jgi:hypothetical protein
MVRVMATAVDASVDTTVLDDPDVEKATRAAIDAYVALQNIDRAEPRRRGVALT